MNERLRLGSAERNAIVHFWVVDDGKLPGRRRLNRGHSRDLKC